MVLSILHSTFYSRLFPVGFCYSQNFVEFTVQNLNNTYLGQNSQFWLRQMYFLFFNSISNTISDQKKENIWNAFFFPIKHLVFHCVEMEAYTSSFLTRFTRKNAKVFKLQRFVKDIKAFTFAT